MTTTRRVFTLALFLSALLLSSTKASAQTGVSYRFLEVLDTEGKPVTDAKVETIGGPPGPKQTDEHGQVKDLPVYIGDYNTRDFKVSKPGYLTYEGQFFDGALSVYREFFESVESDRNAPIKVVLLKEPVTDAERKAVEAEQRRRELLSAVKQNDAATVERLLRAGVSPDASDFNGIPAVLFAAANANAAMIKALLAAGADVRNKGRPGRTVLLLYIYVAHMVFRVDADGETVRSLIKAGADVNAVSKRGTSVLGFAKQSGNTEVIKLLEEAGAR